MADIKYNSHAQDVLFVQKFQSNLEKLLAVLGKSDVDVLAPGTALAVYKASGTLSTTAVAENDEIPASTYTLVPETVSPLAYGKYRKLTSLEQCQKFGASAAVARTNESMLRDIQKAVRKSIFDGVKAGTGTASGTGFQAAIANAWAAIEVAFEDEQASPVYFAHPTDVAGYLGGANVTLQTAFGLSYLENFLGLGTVIVDSNVTAGQVWATASENINVVAARLSDIPEFELETDGSGIIGVHNGARYANAAIETVAYTGLTVFPSFLDRVVKSTISAASGN